MDDLKQQVRELLEKSPERSSRLNDICRELKIPAELRRDVRRALRELEADAFITRLRGHTFISAKSSRLITGTLRMSRRGFGFITPDVNEELGEPAGDVFVSAKNVGEALTGDQVRVRILPPRSGRSSDPGLKREGRIVEVLQRGTPQIVGTFYRNKKGGHVIPHDRTIGRTVATPLPHPNLGVEEGAYVLTEITGWTHKNEPLIGKVIELIGYPDDKGIDITLLVRDSGVEPDFPEEVLQAAEQVPSVIPAEEIANRTDFRDIITFTMDGSTAKDFDDAISIERLDNGRFRLGVHIADVSYYVRENSVIDLEAYDRATSIYPVDRVVPMLPERLSNDMCSLRPDEDRLTMSCLMDIDEEGMVHNYSIHQGIIRSAHRLIYEEVQSVMDGTAPPELAKKLGGILLQLEDLYRLRQILTGMRLRRGALDLDIPETTVVFKDDGTVSHVDKRNRLDAHRVIEECMLIANEVVATHLFNLPVPSVYRVHEDPDMEKLRSLVPVLSNLGVKIAGKKQISSDTLQKALKQTAHLDAGPIARRLILRAMMRARYFDENLGHYGLASACYTHFTSPIRRYPDLIIHRLLRETMENGAKISGKYRPPIFGEDHDDDNSENFERSKALSPERLKHWQDVLPSMVAHCSDRERRAEDIEKDAVLTTIIAYMRKFLGQEFEGIVTGFNSWGMFVELKDIPVEGVVRYKDIHDDYYEYDDEYMRLVGKQTGRVIKLSEKVRVVLEVADVSAMTLDFIFIEKLSPDGESTRRGKGRDSRRSGKPGKPNTGKKPHYRGIASKGNRKGGKRRR